ncbi:hypothetical protein NCY95_00955, partial [Phocaeicola vulgatus]|nr:hypothetical protein [Phocaeicola vulgatus]
RLWKHSGNRLNVIIQHYKFNTFIAMFLIISEIYLFLFRTHVNIGRNPASTSGSVFNVNFVYALKEDNSKFVEFIVKATLE